jgi:serine beta-lactamase-like protein LACTB, mitochondrial
VTPTRWRAEAALALFFAVVMVAGTGVLYFACTPDTVHTDSAAIRSAAADVDAGPHTGAVEEARRLARALLVEQNLPGLSVAVAVDGAVVWAEGFGYADVDRTPVTPLTRFRLGALSKPLTAVAAAVLHDRGRLDLDAPVHRYVRGYPDKRWTVTTRQLMGDVAGVHRIRGDNNDAMPDRHCESLDEAVAMLANDPLLFEPGTEHRYSIWGWVLVSAAVEGAAGEPFGRFMVRQVFEPLAMERTSVAETEGLDDVASYSLGSVLTTRLGIKKASLRPDYSCLAGAGAFLSTPTDLVRFSTAMLKPGLLTSETIAAFQTPTRLVSGASTTYSLGWTLSTVQLAGEPARMVSHRGSPRGGTVSLLTFPDLGLAVAAAGNVSNTKGVDPLALRIAEVFTRHQNRQALPRNGTARKIVSSSR